MKFRKLDEGREYTSNVVYEKHVTEYMNKVKFGLCCSMIFVFFTEVFMFLFIKYGDISSSAGTLFIPSRWIPDFAYFRRHLLLPNLINWTLFFSLLSIYKRVSFYWKKIIICSLYILVTTVYSFGHWGFIYLSIIYLIPVIVTCPLGKKANTYVFIICGILQIIYALYHFCLIHSMYNFLILAMNLAALVATYFLCFCIFNAFTNLTLAVQKYATLSTELKVKVGHDALTGAYSKRALFELGESIQKYKSIAFIDLDNFKEVNDTLSHAVGDEILKTLVNTFKNQGQLLYRYGGDEFIAFSAGEPEEFEIIIKNAKDEFVNICAKDFSAKTTFSAGIVPILNNKNIETLLNAADKIMYTVKNSGKNDVAIGK